MSDIVEVQDVILKERQGRDRGWWKQMEECFHPDSLVNLSWFRGTGADFTAGSKRMSESGVRTVHRLSPPIIHLLGQRAIAELPAAIEVRFSIHDVEVDLVSYSRLLYRVERRETGWKVLNLDAIYERDTIAPAIPGTILKVDPRGFSRFRQSYRCLAYHLSLRGISPRDDLYGDDRPEPVRILYEAAFEWLNQ